MSTSNHVDSGHPSTTGLAEPARADLGTATVLVLVPLAAAVVSVAVSWRYPVAVGDTAWLTQRVADVTSGRWPTVGMPSSIGRGDLATHHPGPIQFYWLAPWWAISGFRGIVVGTAVGSLMALYWLGALVRRLPGASTLAAVGSQIAAVVGLFTVSTEMLADPWNPYAALPWLVLLVAGAVSISCRDRIGWWAVVVAGPVVGQLHVGFLPLVAAAVVAVLWTSWRNPPARPERRSAVLLGATGLLLWAPSLVDLAAGDRNPILLARAVADGGEAVGPLPVVVAAAAALNPGHGIVDAPWLPSTPAFMEWLMVGLALAAAILTWCIADRGHWSRTWVAGFGLSAALWMLLASRALPFQGLLPVAYTRPLWPLASCLWFGVGAAWWALRPERLRSAVWIPIAVMVIWVGSVPRGYVGIDPATRVRATQVAADLADADLPSRADVTARGFLGGWWLAPTVTAELDRRGVENGVGTDKDWDVAIMTDRPRPLPANDCELVVGDVPPEGPVLAPARGLSSAEAGRLEELQAELIDRFPSVRASRSAADVARAQGVAPLPDASVADLVRSGWFADLVVQGSIAGVSMRDNSVREYVELTHRAAPNWAGVTVWARDC